MLPDLPKYADWKAFEDEWLNVPGLIADYKHLRVDTSLSVDENMSQIFQYLSPGKGIPFNPYR